MSGLDATESSMIESMQREISLWKSSGDIRTYEIAVNKAMQLMAKLSKSTEDHPALRMFKAFIRFQVGGSRLTKPIMVPASFGILIPSPEASGEGSVDFSKGDKISLERYRALILDRKSQVLMPRKGAKQLDARERVFGSELFSMKNMEYTSREGMVLSNILMSRFVDIIKLRGNVIDYEIYTTVAQPIALANPETPCVVPLNPDSINFHTCTKVILGWLKKSGFYTAGAVHAALTPPHKVVVTRRCLLTPISFLVAGAGNEYEGHEIAIFWEFNHRQGKYHFYIVDNLTIQSYAYASSRNVFKDAILHCITPSFQQMGIPLSREHFEIHEIHNQSVMFSEDELFQVDGYECINYLCTSAARRSALYGARVVDFRDNALWNEQDSAEAFFKHFNQFIHQMHRMLNWCMYSKHVWPKSKTDPHNTILPPEPFMISPGLTVLEYILDKEKVFPAREDITEDLVVKLEPSLSYLNLRLVSHTSPAEIVDMLHGQPSTLQRFYFHLEGEEAFSTVPPSDFDLRGGGGTCHVSSAFKCI